MDDNTLRSEPTYTVLLRMAEAIERMAAATEAMAKVQTAQWEQFMKARDRANEDYEAMKELHGSRPRTVKGH